MAVPLYVLPWSPGSNTAATSRRAQHAPTGMPLPIALASVTTSGAHAVVLEAEPPAGAAEPGLDLVDHHQRAGLVADLADRRAGSRRGAGLTPPSPCTGSISTAATDGVDGLGDGVDVAPRDVVEALGHRLERLVLGRLAGRRERRQRAAVEAAERADDDVAAAAAVLAGQLERALDGLGAGVGEEDLAVVAGGLGEQAVDLDRRRGWPPGWRRGC